MGWSRRYTRKTIFLAPRKLFLRPPFPPIWFAFHAPDLWRYRSGIASKFPHPIQNVRAVTRAHRRVDRMGFLHVKWWLIALLTVLAGPAKEQTFPSKTIRIIVPYAAGGSIDLTAGVIAKDLQDGVGQSVIVDNKPGANAAIGIEALLRSDPDGHTLVILSDSPVTINVHLSRLNYDPLTDLVPISKVVSSPIILAANAKAKIASIADLVAAAKAGPL